MTEIETIEELYRATMHAFGLEEAMATLAVMNGEEDADKQMCNSIMGLINVVTEMIGNMKKCADRDGSDEAKILVMKYAFELNVKLHRLVVAWDVDPVLTAYALNELKKMGVIDQNKDTNMEL